MSVVFIVQSNKFESDTSALWGLLSAQLWIYRFDFIYVESFKCLANKFLVKSVTKFESSFYFEIFSY